MPPEACSFGAHCFGNQSPFAPNMSVGLELNSLHLHKIDHCSQKQENPADLVAYMNTQGGALKTSKVASSRAGDNTKSLGLDWPHTKETRWIHSQEGHGVEPTGEVK